MNEKVIELAQAMREDPGIHKFFSGDKFCPNDRQAFADHFYELLSAILDPPTPDPKVDWERAIQTRGGEPAKLLHRINRDVRFQNFVLTTALDGLESVYAVSDDGRFNECSESHCDIINTPAPAVVEFAYECCIASHPKRDIAIAIRISGVIDVHILTATGARYEYTSEQAAIIHDWNLSPWQRQKVVG